MSSFTENWANLSRWTIPSGKSVTLSGGRCYAAPGAANTRAELVETSPGGLPFLFVQVEASIVDGFSIRCFDPDGVFLFHETRFVHEYGSFYLDRFTDDGAPIRRRLFSLPAGEYLFRVAFVESFLVFKVYQGATLIRYLETSIGQLGEVHAIALSPGQALDPDAGPQPWIGQVVSVDGLNRYSFPPYDSTLLGPETLDYPSLVVPDLPDQILFREGAYTSWSSPSFGGSGNLIFSTPSRLPSGISLTPNGSSLVFSGIPVSGSTGDWPIDVVVDDGLQPKTISVVLRIGVLSSFDIPGDVVTEESLALGDFYYQISGGPLRKEMSRETP